MIGLLRRVEEMCVESTVLGAEWCSVEDGYDWSSKSSACNSEPILLWMYRKIPIQKLHVVIKFSLQWCLVAVTPPP